jgi:hypothetical protein
MNGPDKVITVSSSPIGAALTNGLIESNHQMHIGTANVVYKSQSSDRPIGGYVLGGLGIYHRLVQLTSPSVGYATVCDPYWYVVLPGAGPIDTIIGDRSSNDFGINFGGGITFGHDAKFYIDRVITTCGGRRSRRWRQSSRRKQQRGVLGRLLD